MEKLPLEKAVDVYSKESLGRTPLSYATKNGHEAVVKLLLEKAVDMGSKDIEHGLTSLTHAAMNGHEAASNHSSKVHVVDLLKR
jgi:ankyrin repeat protein